MSWLGRFSRFNIVAVIGMAVQVAALALLVELRLHYLVATTIAVITAIVHNFVWHRQWTWGRREPGQAAHQFIQFAVANGSVSLMGNIVLMPAFVAALGIPIVPANLLAIALCGCVNFLLASRIFGGCFQTSSAVSGDRRRLRGRSRFTIPPAEP